MLTQAQYPCGDPPVSTYNKVSETALALCHGVKNSDACQKLYAGIRQETADYDNFIRQCTHKEIASDSQFALLSADKIWGCASGVFEATFGDFGRFIGEGLAKIVTDVQINRECNKSLEYKKRLYIAYNVSVPKELQQNIPSDSALNAHSCTQIRGAIYEENRYKKVVLARQNPKSEVPSPKDSLIKKAQAQLQEFGVRLECYPPKQAARLMCETISYLSMSGAGAAVAATKVVKLAGLGRPGIAASGTSLKLSPTLTETTRKLGLSEKQATKLFANKSPEQISKIENVLIKIEKGDFLTPDEAAETARLLSDAKARGLINFHLTDVGNIDKIIDSRQMHSLHPSKQIWALGYRLDRDVISKSMNAAGKKLGDGTVVFQGDAAQLFRPHPSMGIMGATKRLQGHQVTTPGKIIIEEYKKLGDTLVVTKARIEPLQGLEKIKANSWIVVDIGTTSTVAGLYAALPILLHDR